MILAGGGDETVSADIQTYRRVVTRSRDVIPYDKAALLWTINERFPGPVPVLGRGRS